MEFTAPMQRAGRPRRKAASKALHSLSTSYAPLLLDADPDSDGSISSSQARSTSRANAISRILDFSSDSDEFIDAPEDTPLRHGRGKGRLGRKRKRTSSSTAVPGAKRARAEQLDRDDIDLIAAAAAAEKTAEYGGIAEDIANYSNAEACWEELITRTSSQTKTDEEEVISASICVEDARLGVDEARKKGTSSQDVNSSLGEAGEVVSETPNPLAVLPNSQEVLPTKKFDLRVKDGRH
ncbi:hypothetical protein MMC28_000478 [Mycoblastus sanguinarius]|nr:hypothetical protein [Mycoblastus sanguinarius]